MAPSGPDKVATLLLTLDRPTAAGLLQRLPETERQAVTQSFLAMATWPTSKACCSRGRLLCFRSGGLAAPVASLIFVTI